MLITANGSKQVFPKDGKRFTLEELQACVEGYIEAVFLTDSQVLIINEEGKLQGMELNPFATILYQSNRQTNDVIVGPALLCHRSEID